jgi:hypothetical protein
MRRLLMFAGAVFGACSAPLPLDQRTEGVRIFAEDTVTARINVQVHGDLRVSVKGDDFMIRRDRSILVSTPATMEVVRGGGTATIVSMDSTKRIAVVPIGTPDDSIDVATVTGTTVAFTRPGPDGSPHRIMALRP